MKKHQWRVILLLVLALILTGSIPACGQPDQQAMQANAELRQSEEQNFFELYDTMKRHIENAHTLASELQNFGWHVVSNLAWEYKDQYNISRYKFLSELLPSAETIQPVLTCYDEYYALAVKVWQENPYKEPQPASQETKRLTIPQWREVCAQLELQLGKAEAQAQELKLTTDNQFAYVERILSSKTSLEYEYLRRFQDESAQYADSLNEAISNLGQAKKAASELKNWQFTSLAWQEGVVQILPTQEEETQVPPATEGAALGGKKLTYEDDFSNPYSGWRRLSSEEADLDYQNNEYHIKVKKFNFYYFVYGCGGRFADFILEVDARQVSGLGGSCGLFFRAQDSENFYCFSVSADGYYAISAMFSGMPLILQPKKRSDLIKTGNSTNHLKVICKGSEFEVYVNGNYLTTITDKSLADGYVGMGVQTSNSEAHFAFDNIKACSIDAEFQ